MGGIGIPFGADVPRVAHESQTNPNLLTHKPPAHPQVTESLSHHSKSLHSDAVITGTLWPGDGRVPCRCPLTSQLIVAELGVLPGLQVTSPEAGGFGCLWVEGLGLRAQGLKFRI